MVTCTKNKTGMNYLTDGEVGCEGRLVGGESPDAEVVDGDDALHREEGVLHYR